MPPHASILFKFGSMPFPLLSYIITAYNIGIYCTTLYSCAYISIVGLKSKTSLLTGCTSAFIALSLKSDENTKLQAFLGKK